MHLKSLEDIQSQCEIPRSDAGVDESGVGVYVWCDATPAHIGYQSHSLTQLLPLPTQADHCMSFRPILRTVFAADDVTYVYGRRTLYHKQMVHIVCDESHNSTSLLPVFVATGQIDYSDQHICLVHDRDRASAFTAAAVSPA